MDVHDDILEYFPYTPRKYQKEAIAAIRSAVGDGKRFCLHAPTGFGKTPVVLAALLPLVEGTDGSIIWAVRTGNETDRPIDELKVISGSKSLFGLSFRGKRDMCLLARDLKVASYEGVGNLCRMRREKCPYYRNLSRLKERGELAPPPRPLTFSEVFNLAKKMEVCPYFLQIAFLEHARVISLSYNYILSPLGWVMRHKVPFRRSILVVDESHNVERAAMELNSRSITTKTIDRALKEAHRYDPEDESGLGEKLDLMLRFSHEVAVQEDGTFFLDSLLERTGLMPEDIRELYSLAEDVYRDQMRRGKEPRSYLHSIAEFLVVALEKRNQEGVAYLYSKEGKDIKLEVWDMRTREYLAPVWDEFRSVVFMSGTLEPIEAFTETAGIGDCRRMSISSMADPDKVRSLIVTGVSTKGERLSREMVRRYLRVIDAFLSLSGNLAIFTASYRVQDEVMEGIRDLAREHGRPFFIERKDMPGDEASRMLSEFKSLPKEGKEGLLIAPAGGRFAEGADFPGKELEGIMLLGIPFDRLTTKTKLFVNYNQRIYGRRRGRYLAYTVPALRKASQALGRVIRSEEDEGTFLLADERYAKRMYFKLLPDFVKQTVNLARWDDLRPQY